MRAYLYDSLALIGIGAVAGVVLVGALVAFGHVDPSAPLLP